MLAVQEVMEKYVKMSIMSKEKPGGSEEEAEDKKDADNDHVLAYACDVLSLGLLYMEFSDAIREGDGTRILRCWRYLMLVFKSSGRKNYSIEAFSLLAQYHFLFTERMRMQLLWSRTVNVHGRPGKNIACDLHNEHLNRECKCSISELGANITDRAIQRVGRSLRSTTSILDNFDTINGIATLSGHHTVRSSGADFDKLIKQLQESSVFCTKPGRRHTNFPKHQSNILRKLSRKKLLKWFRKRWGQLMLYH